MGVSLTLLLVIEKVQIPNHFPVKSKQKRARKQRGKKYKAIEKVIYLFIYKINVLCLLVSPLSTSEHSIVSVCEIYFKN